MMGSIFSKKICGFKKLFRMRRRHFESREFRVSWENPPCPTEAVEKFRFDFSMRTHTCIGFAKKHMKSPPHPSPLPHGDCVAIRKPEPSFPRKRESSRNFIHDLSPLDARVRGHDELRHSLFGREDGRDFWE